MNSQNNPGQLPYPGYQNTAQQPLLQTNIQMQNQPMPGNRVDPQQIQVQSNLVQGPNSFPNDGLNQTVRTDPDSVRDQQTSNLQPGVNPSYGQPGPGFGQPGPGYGQPGPGFGQPGPGYGQPGPGFGQPGPGYGQPRPGQPGPGYGQPGPGYGQPGSNFGPNFGRPGPNSGQPGANSGQPGANSGQPGPSYGQGGRPGQYNQDNPTGLNRLQTGNNIAAQNIQGNRNAAYENSQECWGNFYGGCYTYVCCCCCPSAYQTVPEGYTGVIMRFGKVRKLLAPGLHYLNPDIDTLILVDKREKVLPLAKQIVVTRDNIQMKIDAVAYYKIVDTYKSQFGPQNLQLSLIDLLETTIRSVFGRMTLQEMLIHRDELAESIRQSVEGPTFNWGIQVLRTLVQDIYLPNDIKSQMSAGALAKKIAEGNVIKAQADVQSAKLMREAAEILATDAAMQIRYVETLEALTTNGNAKMVFFPSDYTQLGSANEQLESYVKEETMNLLGN